MKIGIACRYKFRKEPARSMVHFDAVVDILRNVKPPAIAPKKGDGAVKTPYVPNVLGHWYYLAMQKSKAAPIFIRVGGRLIARWGSLGGKFRDYCTDMTEFDLLLKKILLKVSESENHENELRVLNQRYIELDDMAGINTKLSSYSRKALRIGEVEDRVAAHWSRNLLQGLDECHSCPELASTLCALFISEVHRVPQMFALSLMLLDLVETATTYGDDGGKTYTWKSMLMHDTSKILGRSPGQKGLAKHPMAGSGTVKLGKDLFGYGSGTTNVVRDRVISIMSVWLTHYMTRHHGEGGKYKFFIVWTKSRPTWTGSLAGSLKKPDQFLQKNCTQAVQQRVSNPSCLIGGTEVTYETVDGDEV